MLLTDRVKAKAAELTSAGRPVSERSLWRLLSRYREEGVNGLIDRRRRRKVIDVGRLDPRLVAVVEEVLAGQSLETTGSRTRTIALSAVRAQRDGLELPSRATMFRVVKALDRRRRALRGATTSKAEP